MERSSCDLRFALLGPVRAWRNGSELELGPPQQRALLALLLAGSDRAVTVEEIVDVLWRADSPASAVNIVQRYVGRLRRLLDPELPPRSEGTLLVRSGGGYRLEAASGSVDLLVFRRGVEQARRADAAGDAELCVRLLVEALDLWRGPVAANVEVDVRTHPAFVALEREYVSAVRQAADVALRAGAGERALVAVQRAAEAYPLDESLQARLIRMLAATGQQAAAFTAFHALRDRLSDELGVDPGAEVRAAHESVLSESAAPPAQPAQPAAPRLPAVVPAQLPVDLATFSGRRDQVAELLERVSDAHRTVLISAIGGMAGIGKTTLAIHVAHRLAGRFPDGQLYSNLRGFDPDEAPLAPADVLRGFLEALDVPPERVPSGLDARAALFRSSLAGRRMLILLDNARDTAQVTPLLPGTPGALVLVTSRSHLLGLVAMHGAHALVLDVLPVDEARDFLARRVGEARVAAEPDAAEEIIARCARLPLALAIVAARAAGNRAFTLSSIAAELRHADGSLHAFAGPDAAIDARTVFSWSYRTLSQGAARLFRLLAVHPGRGEVGLHAAAALAGAPAQPLLAELVAANLLAETSPGRYAFHDLLHAYAAELTEEGEGREALRRVLDHYLHTAHAAHRAIAPLMKGITVEPPVRGVPETRFTDEERAETWLRTEHRVLVAAIQTAARSGFDRHAWQLAWALTEFLERRGYREEALATHRTAVQAAERLGDPGAQAHGYHNLGGAARDLGRTHEALDYASRALELFGKVGDLDKQAQAMRSVSYELHRQGRTAEALALTEQALELFTVTGDARGQATTLNDVGWYHMQLGHYQQGLEHCTSAVERLARLGFRRGEAAAWDSVGYGRHRLGQFQQAIIAYRCAVELRNSTGTRYPEASSLGRLGDVHLDAGEPEAAREAWQAALTILTDLRHSAAEEIRTKLAAL
ncbi:BTAD domain-containing putative transcriptional regulator [Nonomuraea sp. NPDC049709]|uniref:AfsR/SARP family transcriptional regulator n=1 Tax=Nonomuraea sp. NPDC049709 TaxID=3154736 RepID=UPI00341D9C40